MYATQAMDLTTIWMDPIHVHLWCSRCGGDRVVDCCGSRWRTFEWNSQLDHENEVSNQQPENLKYTDTDAPSRKAQSYDKRRRLFRRV